MKKKNIGALFMNNKFPDRKIIHQQETCYLLVLMTVFSSFELYPFSLFHIPPKTWRR